MTDEDVILEEPRHVRDDEVERIPWREFIRSQFRKIIGFLILLMMLFTIIQLSRRISPDSTEINPDRVLVLDTTDHILLMAISSILFLIVLIVFTKVVLIDHKEEFGITSWRQPRVVITALLTTSFISLVYILLDISLINIYLMTLPSWLLWVIQGIHPVLDGIIPNTTDRLAYSNIRGYYFVGLLLLLFFFPLTMYISILTRYGRRTIKNQREKERKLPTSRLLLGLGISGAFTLGSIFISFSVVNEVISAFFMFIALGFLLVSIIFGFLLFINAVRFTLLLTFSNFLLIFPFIFLFYLLPAGLWGVWDLVVILTTDSIDNTIYTILPNLSPSISPDSVNNLNNSDLMFFYLQTVMLNLRSILRIIELDFILVVGVSALVIGFAEGYSIFSIVRGIAQGVSIAKTGRVAARSSPKIIVITSRLLYLGAWLSFFWDNLLVLGRALSSTLNLSIDFFELPQFLNIIVAFSLDLANFSDTLLVFTILAVPFYFILTSSFKFLSVSLVLERVRDDKQWYYLLISSAYILIITTILADIASLPDFVGAHQQYLPLAGAASQDLLPFVSKIFEILESIAFYGGIIVTIIISIKRYIRKSNSDHPKNAVLSNPEEDDDSN